MTSKEHAEKIVELLEDLAGDYRGRQRLIVKQPLDMADSVYWVSFYRRMAVEGFKLAEQHVQEMADFLREGGPVVTDAFAVSGKSRKDVSRDRTRRGDPSTDGDR